MKRRDSPACRGSLGVSLHYWVPGAGVTHGETHGLCRNAYFMTLLSSGVLPVCLAMSAMLKMSITDWLSSFHRHLQPRSGKYMSHVHYCACGNLHSGVSRCTAPWFVTVGDTFYRNYNLLAMEDVNKYIYADQCVKQLKSFKWQLSIAKGKKNSFTTGWWPVTKGCP